MCFLNSSLQRELETSGLEAYVSLYLTFLSADLTANTEITAAALLLQVYGERYVDQMGVIDISPVTMSMRLTFFRRKRLRSQPL